MTGRDGFDALMVEAMSTAERFGHREHVHLTWLAVRRYGVAAAFEVISEGLLRAARSAGAVQKYHVTMTRAWVELVGHHAAHSTADDFGSFAAEHPALLDTALLRRFYRPETLAGPQARSEWVEPDLAPFPWQRVG